MEGKVIRGSALSFNLGSKKPRSAGMNILVYDHPLHPELVTTTARRIRTMGEFDVTMWLVEGGGHMAGVTHRHTICELACFPQKSLPDRGLVDRLPCKGDKQFDVEAGPDHHYYLTLNEEHLTDTQFENAAAELQRIADEQDGIMTHRKTELGQTDYMSVLVAALHRRAVHIEGFHLLSDARVMIRTQSIVEPNSR